MVHYAPTLHKLWQELHQKPSTEFVQMSESKAFYNFTLMYYSWLLNLEDFAPTYSWLVTSLNVSFTDFND